MFITSQYDILMHVLDAIQSYLGQLYFNFCKIPTSEHESSVRYFAAPYVFSLSYLRSESTLG